MKQNPLIIFHWEMEMFWELFCCNIFGQFLLKQILGGDITGTVQCSVSQYPSRHEEDNTQLQQNCIFPPSVFSASPWKKKKKYWQIEESVQDNGNKRGTTVGIDLWGRTEIAVWVIQAKSGCESWMWLFEEVVSNEDVFGIEQRNTDCEDSRVRWVATCLTGRLPDTGFQEQAVWNSPLLCCG